MSEAYVPPPLVVETQIENPEVKKFVVKMSILTAGVIVAGIVSGRALDRMFGTDPQ